MDWSAVCCVTFCLVCAPFISFAQRKKSLYSLDFTTVCSICLYNMYVCVCLDGMGVGGRVRPLGRAGDTVSLCQFEQRATVNTYPRCSAIRAADHTLKVVLRHASGLCSCVSSAWSPSTDHHPPYYLWPSPRLLEAATNPVGTRPAAAAVVEPAARRGSALARLQVHARRRARELLRRRPPRHGEW